MFKRFKKNKKFSTFHAVASGTLLPISAVEDGVFSEKLLGDGYAVQPANGEVYSPVEGKILSIFPTKHAITIETTAGFEILLHMGLDTVELKGEPFEIFVTEGQKVTAETKLATMDLEKLKETNTPSTIVVIITNMDKVKDMPKTNEKAVHASEEIFSIDVE